MEMGQQFDSAPIYSGSGRAERNNGGWRTHAIADNGSLTGSEPGAKWSRYAALVPVHQLMRFKEYDRAGSQGMAYSKENINSIAKDLSTHGVQGLNEPLHINYDHEQKWGLLEEGNHRLAAAIQAGITHLPVIIHGRGELYKQKSSRLGAPLHMDTRIHEEDVDYHPSMIHPGNFQEFEGAR